MNETCPYCGEHQHFPIQWIDSMVACGKCGREFLLSKKRRDGPVAGGYRPREDVLRWFWLALLCLLVFLCITGPFLVFLVERLL